MRDVITSRCVSCKGSGRGMFLLWAVRCWRCGGTGNQPLSTMWWVP
jgi:DnaJ-class molecular chaperone